jgi:hypothetical protein
MQSDATTDQARMQQDLKDLSAKFDEKIRRQNLVVLQKK